MSTDNRDTRPATARFAEIEAALDKRVLAALAAAWSMAKDRQLVAGNYITRAGVEKLAADMAGQSVTSEQAADVIAGLNALKMSNAGEALGEDALDHVWQVIA